jgi:hypothetical protein
LNCWFGAFRHKVPDFFGPVSYSGLEGFSIAKIRHLSSGRTVSILHSLNVISVASVIKWSSNDPREIGPFFMGIGKGPPITINFIEEMKAALCVKVHYVFFTFEIFMFFLIFGYASLF